MSKPIAELHPSLRTPNPGNGPTPIVQLDTAQVGSRRFLRMGRQPARLAQITDAPFPGTAIRDIRRGLNVPDRTQYGIALHHVIADLSQAGAIALLRATRRALLPGGVARVTVPWGHALCDDRGATVRRYADIAGLQTLSTHATREPMLVAAAPDGMVLEFATPRHQRAEQPSVTVVLHVKNARMAYGALATVLAQTYADFDVLLGDAGDDRTAALQVEASDLRVRRVPSRDALELASGDYIAVVNEGERLDPDALQRLAACLQALPDIALVAAYRPFMDEDGAARITPRLAFDDLVVHGESAASLLLHTRVDLIGGAATRMFRRLQMPKVDIDVSALSDMAQTLALLSRGDLAWLAEPVSHCIPTPTANAAGVANDTRIVQDWGERIGLWEPASPTALRARRMGLRPWWSHQTRRSWGRTLTANDQHAHAAAWTEVSEQRPKELQSAVQQAHALARAGRWPEAARVATLAAQQRPDHVPAAVAASQALAKVGLTDDAHYLLHAASQQGPVVLGEGGHDPSRNPVTFERRWSLWTTVGDVTGRMHLQVRSAGGPAILPICVDGAKVGELHFDGDNTRRDVTLDIEGAASGVLIEFGPSDAANVAFDVRGLRMELNARS